MGFLIQIGLAAIGLYAILFIGVVGFEIFKAVRDDAGRSKPAPRLTSESKVLRGVLKPLEINAQELSR